MKRDLSYFIGLSSGTAARTVCLVVFLMAVILLVFQLGYEMGTRDYFLKSRLRVQHRIHIPVNSEPPGNGSVSRDVKLVLFWSEPDRYPHKGLKGFCFREDFLDECPHKCTFTTDRAQYDTSDAIVFESRRLYTRQEWRNWFLWYQTPVYPDLPPYRRSHQHWIYYNPESQSQTRINLGPMTHLFNLTMTFRRDSHIYAPYGKFGRRFITNKECHLPKHLSSDLLKKKKLIAWGVTNCNEVTSGRNQFVEQLSKFITVDKYGGCSTCHRCTPYNDVCEDIEKCYEYLAPQYKFYLALENSICKDYVTEKFFNSLRYGLLPVVLGGGNHSAIAPAHSYIDASKFSSVSELADYLVFLDENPAAFLEYFEWRKQLRVVDNMNFYEQGWCTLCQVLWERGNERNVIPDLEKWWFHAQCDEDDETRIKPACQAWRVDDIPCSESLNRVDCSNYVNRSQFVEHSEP